jgi:hypothetical protein
MFPTPEYNDNLYVLKLFRELDDTLTSLYESYDENIVRLIIDDVMDLMWLEHTCIEKWPPLYKYGVIPTSFINEGNADDLLYRCIMPVAAVEKFMKWIDWNDFGDDYEYFMRCILPYIQHWTSALVYQLLESKRHLMTKSVVQELCKQFHLPFERYAARYED